MKEQSNKHDIRLSPDSRDTKITPDGIRAQLDRVLSSPDFKASNQVKNIFRYLTDETLSGSEDHISAHSIADQTQNPPPDPEPPIEPIVRIRVNQLRRALKGYYAGEGATNEGPRIEMPEESYAPVFGSEMK